LLQPSLDEVFQTATGLKIDRWKRGTVRDEAGDNAAAILKDIHSTLPPLISAADAAKGSIGSVIPVVRNVDALYDVLLRVSEAARVSAPADQIAQLDQALNSLQKARLALYDRMQDSAAITEKHTTDLEGRLQAQLAIKCPVVTEKPAPACVAPTPAKRVRRKPVKPKPSTEAPSSAPVTKPPVY
jgi:hypothetical protein